MRAIGPRLAIVALAANLVAPGYALAQGISNGATIGNGTIELGVGSDAGLAEGGLGLRLQASSAEGLIALCACSGWSLSVDNGTLNAAVESFTFTPTGAISTVRLTDPARGIDMRVVHDFHPVDGSANLYEATVTAFNLSSAPVQPLYSRSLGWSAGAPDPNALLLDPTLGSVTPTTDGRGLDLNIGLPLVQPTASQTFRLYFGAGRNTFEAATGLELEGASLVSTSQATSAGFVLAYAAGATPPLGQADAGGGGARRGGGGGGGGGGGLVSGAGSSAGGANVGGSGSGGTAANGGGPGANIGGTGGSGSGGTAANGGGAGANIGGTGGTTSSGNTTSGSDSSGGTSGNTSGNGGTTTNGSNGAGAAVTSGGASGTTGANNGSGTGANNGSGIGANDSVANGGTSGANTTSSTSGGDTINTDGTGSGGAITASNPAGANDAGNNGPGGNADGTSTPPSAPNDTPPTDPAPTTGQDPSLTLPFANDLAVSLPTFAPDVEATPELGSLGLMAAGLGSFGSFAALRWRARRPRRSRGTSGQRRDQRLRPEGDDHQA